MTFAGSKPNQVGGINDDVFMQVVVRDHHHNNPITSEIGRTKSREITFKKLRDESVLILKISKSYAQLLQILDVEYSLIVHS